ncbi:MAG TPA: LacI family DNA-binding transcriptional regulator [Cellulomonas sp.]
MKRVTMADVAARAGVSKATVSYALNDRPGLADSTRTRVLAAAEELGWTPNAAARVLSGARTDTVGLVLNRPPSLVGIEPCYSSFLQGIEGELSRHAVSLLMKVVQDHEHELLTLRSWWSGGRVDGVVLIDLRVGDDRPALLAEAGIPVVGVGDPSMAGGMPTSWTDDAASVHSVVSYLAALGHRRIARVADRGVLAHSTVRTAAFHAACALAGVTETAVVEGGATPAEGAGVTRALLTRPDAPTAVVYDNTVTAMAGVAVAAEMGVDVPGRLSVVAWGDPAQCEYTHPTLSAVDHDAMDQGARAVRMLLDLVAGSDPGDGCGGAPVFIPRGSTAPVRPA